MNKKTSRTKEVTKGGLIVALYVVLTLVNPIGSGVIQFRVSEAISLLPFFEKKTTVPVLLGVAIANAFSPLGIIDVVAGLLCGAITYSLARHVRNLYLKGVLFSVVCSVIIGGELSIVVGAPIKITMTSILLSQLIISMVGIFGLKRIMHKLKSFIK